MGKFLFILLLVCSSLNVALGTDKCPSSMCKYPVDMTEGDGERVCTRSEGDCPGFLECDSDSQCRGGSPVVGPPPSEEVLLDHGSQR